MYNYNSVLAQQLLSLPCYNRQIVHIVPMSPFRAGSYGIYTLLDMHQDVLSGKFCGEGAPDWAVDTGSMLHTTPHTNQSIELSIDC